MPRKEANAPTERIIRILDDVSTLEDHVREMNELIAEHFPDSLHLFPPTPTLQHVLEERTRQGLLLNQTRAKRERARNLASLGRDHGVADAVSISDIEKAIKED